MIDWSGLDEVEVFQTIFRNALEAKASCIMISPDNRGAGIYFTTKDELIVFEHLPLKHCLPLLRYIKNMSGIDLYKDPPLEGAGVIKSDDKDFTVSVRIAKGSVGEEIELSIFYL